MAERSDIHGSDDNSPGAPRSLLNPLGGFPKLGVPL